MKKVVMSLILASSSLFMFNTANAASSCYQDSCTGKAVKNYYCPVSFYKSKNIYARNNGRLNKIGRLTFYYSKKCDANWAKVRNVERDFVNQEIWVTVQDRYGSRQTSSIYRNGVAITPMISGKGRVKATGAIDSGGAYTYRASLTY